MKKFIFVFLWVIGGICTVFSQGITKNEAVAMRDKTAKPRTALVEADKNLKSICLNMCIISYEFHKIVFPR